MEWSKRAAVAIVLSFGAAACSSSAASSASTGAPSGTATLDSTLTSMPAHSLASASVSHEPDGSTSIVIANLAGGADSCLGANARSSAANALQLIVSWGSNQLPVPGTYDVGGGWQVRYRVADAACATAGETVAIAGTLEIDSVDASVHGVADVTFPSGRIVATFNAANCASTTADASCKTYPSCPAALGGAAPTRPADACIASP